MDWISEGSLEKPRGPTSRLAIANVTNGAVNRVYEDFLRYNAIDPEDVTLEAARTCIEENNLHQCVRVLPLTRYSLVGDVIVDKIMERSNFNLLFFIKRCLTSGWSNVNICRECIHLAAVNQSTRVTCPFYHKAQSCVSICFNLIEMADPIRLVCLVEARNNTKIATGYGPVCFLGGDGICREISVPNFEKHVVQKYWKEGGQLVHYDADVFEKGSGFLVMLENVLKKVLMMAPTTCFITWLHNVLNYSILSLFGLTGIIHLMYFVLLHGVLINVLPTGLLPKVVAFISGFPVFLLLLLNYFLNSTTAFNLGKEGLIFFFFVEFYEIILRFLVDKCIGLFLS